MISNLHQSWLSSSQSESHRVRVGIKGPDLETPV